jgi:hypothetical protein
VGIDKTRHAGVKGQIQVDIGVAGTNAAKSAVNNLDRLKCARLVGYAIDQNAATDRQIAAVRRKRRGHYMLGAGGAKERNQKCSTHQSMNDAIQVDSPAAIGSAGRG